MHVLLAVRIKTTAPYELLAEHITQHTAKKLIKRDRREAYKFPRMKVATESRNQPTAEITNNQLCDRRDTHYSYCAKPLIPAVPGPSLNHIPYDSLLPHR